jgi:hypothetical protein
LKPFLEAVKKVEATCLPAEKFKSTSRFVHRNYSRSELDHLAELIQQPAEVNRITNSGKAKNGS